MIYCWRCGKPIHPCNEKTITSQVFHKHTKCEQVVTSCFEDLFCSALGDKQIIDFATFCCADMGLQVEMLKKVCRWFYETGREDKKHNLPDFN